MTKVEQSAPVTPPSPDQQAPASPAVSTEKIEPRKGSVSKKVRSGHAGTRATPAEAKQIFLQLAAAGPANPRLVAEAFARLGKTVAPVTIKKWKRNGWSTKPSPRPSDPVASVANSFNKTLAVVDNICERFGVKQADIDKITAEIDAVAIAELTEVACNKLLKGVAFVSMLIPKIAPGMIAQAPSEFSDIAKTMSQVMSVCAEEKERAIRTKTMGNKFEHQSAAAVPALPALEAPVESKVQYLPPMDADDPLRAYLEGLKPVNRLPAE